MTEPFSPSIRNRIVLDSPLIEIHDVSVIREQTRILDDVSLCIPRKRHTAVLGPNGSGKSSLLKLLTRDFYPSVDASAEPGGAHQGTVRILGQSDWEVSCLRRRMGIVTPALDYGFSIGRTGRMTVSEAVASGFTATQLKEFGPAVNDKMAAAIEQAIEIVQMQQFRDKALGTLSTGERRRAMIARAIVHQPDIFVLDEPTGGLDMAAKARFMQILESITNQESMTTVLVTHHLDEIPPAMRHVVLLDRGRVVYDGPKDSALTPERISELFGVSVAVQRQSSGWFLSQVKST